jgi:hypothetical protein
MTARKAASLLAALGSRSVSATPLRVRVQTVEMLAFLSALSWAQPQKRKPHQSTLRHRDASMFSISVTFVPAARKMLPKSCSEASAVETSALVTSVRWTPVVSRA